MHTTSTIISVSAFAFAALAQDSSISFNTMPPHQVAPGSDIESTWVGGETVSSHNPSPTTK